MTTINDISDLVRIVKEEPYWAEVLRDVLLGEEFQKLPVQLAQYIEETREYNRLMKERMDTLEGDVSVLKEDMSTVKEDIVSLKTNVAVLTSRVGNLSGKDAEREVCKNILAIINRPLALHRTRILKGEIVPITTQFNDILDDAETDGLITANAASDLMSADVILSAVRKENRQPVYVVAEVSQTIGEYDITRAQERAATLSIVTQTPTIPVVVGGVIAHQQRTLAAEQNVEVITVRTHVPDEVA